jgi:putative nucleotidyltransferase with HDIG domain
MSKNIPGSKLRFALDNLEALPAMPDIAHKLLALQLDTEAGEAQMLSLVEQDPQIFARVIGLANSPAMGVGRKINSIRDAAMLLGLTRLKSVAIGIATMSRMLNQPAGKNFDPHDLWTHSMTVAIVMNVIAQKMPKRIRPDDNQIFLAGLLHDIGLMALHHLDPEASDELHRQLRLYSTCPINDLELELLGMTHNYIGAQLVRHWHLPDDIVDVVELHHSPRSGNEAFANPLVRLVNIAEKLLPDFGISEHTNDAIDESEWRELCIDPVHAAEFSEIANELAIQVAQLPDTLVASRPAAIAPAARSAAPAIPAAVVHPVSRMRFANIVASKSAIVRWIRRILP